jgi:prophage regulatory protein
VRNSQQIQPATTPKAQAESPTAPITYAVGRLSNARILRLKQVVTTVGLAKSSIYRKIQIGTFPPPIKLGGARASGWLSTEVLEWIEDQVRRRPKTERSREL